MIFPPWPLIFSPILKSPTGSNMEKTQFLTQTWSYRDPSVSLIGKYIGWVLTRVSNEDNVKLYQAGVGYILLDREGRQQLKRALQEIDDAETIRG